MQIEDVPQKKKKKKKNHPKALASEPYRSCILRKFFSFFKKHMWPPAAVNRVIETLGVKYIQSLQ